MGEYIVSPMFFYWIELLDDVEFMAALFWVIALAIFIAAGAVCYANWDSGSDDEARVAGKICKIAAVAVIIIPILIVVTPDQDTMLAVYIAKYATFENAELTIESIKGAVDYLVDSMKELQ